MLHSLDVEKVLSHAGRRKLVRMAVTAMVELYGDRWVLLSKVIT